MCLCVTGVGESTNMSPRGKLPSCPLFPPPLLPLPKLLHCPVLTFHPLVSDRVILHSSQPSSSFVLFCSFVLCSVLSFRFLFLLLLLLLLLRLWMHVCMCARVCACVRECVFSPAASVDYGSFADRCSTWLELLRLKAHTIRRGSVKTSRRTQSLAHSGDHTHKYRTRFTSGHTYAHTPLHACRWGAEHCKSSTSFVFFFLARVWKLTPRPSEGSTICSLPKTVCHIRKVFAFCVQHFSQIACWLQQFHENLQRVPFIPLPCFCITDSSYAWKIGGDTVWMLKDFMSDLFGNTLIITVGRGSKLFCKSSCDFSDLCMLSKLQSNMWLWRFLVWWM